VLGGVTVPTIISGVLSTAAGSAGVWFVARKGMNEGWFEIGDWWFVGVYSAVVVVASLGVLLSLLNNDEVSADD